MTADLSAEAAERVAAGRPGPLITDAGPGFVDVTFACAVGSDEGQVLIISGFAQGDLDARLLPPVADTGIAARTWRLPSEYLGTYLFWVSKSGVELPTEWGELLPVIHSSAGAPRPDPTNPERFVYPIDPENPGPEFAQSIVRGSDAIAEPLVGAPLLGTLSERRVTSTVLGDERRVWVHTSVGADESDEPPALMLVLDGGIFAHLIHLPEIVDAMVASGELPPMVTIYCHYASEAARNEELQCREEFASFVVDELLEWVDAGWTVTTDPARTIVAGSSYGGLSATWLAYRHPERFGNVIAQSPSYGWHPDNPTSVNASAERWERDGSKDVRFYVEMGTFETGVGDDGRSGYDHTQDFVAMLRRHGNDVDYRDFCGGHDYLSWRATSPRALRSIVDRWG